MTLKNDIEHSKQTGTFVEWIMAILFVSFLLCGIFAVGYVLGNRY